MLEEMLVLQDTPDYLIDIARITETLLLEDIKTEY